MRFKFTKMQGAGNDFVVLDGMRAPVMLDAAQCRWIADRRFGIGADQILVVAPPVDPSRADFSYRIFNADGGEVEQCGNGARAFARYVRERGYADAASIRVETLSGVITPTIEPNGDVTVDMRAPRLAPTDVPFDANGLAPRRLVDESLWPLDVAGRTIEVAVLSMGNPHAVLVVPEVASADVATLGPAIEHHPRFARRVNAGFMEVVDRKTIRLRVHERGAGETLACGTGACAAVVSGIRRGLLDSPVAVHLRGGTLVVAWAGGTAPVMMRGPAVTVFEGEVIVPAAAEIAAGPHHQSHHAPPSKACTDPSTLEPSPT